MATNITPERQDVLIRLLRDRKEEGMRTLFKYYAGALMTIIQPIVGKNEIAEEVLQDVLIKIWKNIGQYDAQKSRLFTWMARIARNSAIDKTRSKEFKQRSKTDGITSIVGNRRELSQTTPTDGIGVAALLEQLDGKYRLLLELVYLKGYSQSEAAKELQIPLGTVKTRVRKAISQLRHLLRKEMICLVFVPLFYGYFQNM